VSSFLIFFFLFSFSFSFSFSFCLNMPLFVIPKKSRTPEGVITRYLKTRMD